MIGAFGRVDRTDCDMLLENVLAMAIHIVFPFLCVNGPAPLSLW